MNKQICLSFDWELFFKQSGTIEQCQLRPTQALLDLGTELGIPMVFFVDVMQLWRFGELQDSSYLQALEEQIQEMVRRGHRVELHLHPHWLDAVHLERDLWQFPHYERYRLDSLDAEQVLDLVLRGKQSLETICRNVDPHYQVRAFRAGGWCIQPFEPKIRQALASAGIQIDSSVVPGMVGHSQAHIFDFSQAPQLEQWNFSTDPCVPDSQGEFTQIPISSYRKKFWHKIAEKLMSKLAPVQIYGNGKGIDLAEKASAKFASKTVILTLETPFPALMQHHIHAHPLQKLVLLSHPKGISSKSLQLIRDLHRSGHQFFTLS